MHGGLLGVTFKLLYLKSLIYEVYEIKFILVRLIYEGYEIRRISVFGLFLSTPVLMHGGLICIAFCLLVTPPKFRLEVNSYHRKYRRSELVSNC